MRRERLRKRMDLCEKKDCTGCFACKSVCPKGAISTGQDELHKTIPVIDTEKCIECGLCRKVCPALNQSEYREPLHCYASWTKNSADQIDCASGGIATTLSRSFMRNGGKVYGTAYEKNLDLKIKMAASEEDLEVFKSSKYVQSDTADSYISVKEQLQQGKEVLYIGTPCQINGLLHFLQKPYENLYTVDLICHGVPPIEYLKEYINNIISKKKIDKVDFRGKYDYYFTAYSGKDIVYQKRNYEDLYYDAFSKGVIFRDNCYSCAYARKERVSDITIGDFWGIDKKSLKNRCDARVSLVFTNTLKGEKLLAQTDNLYIEERTMEDALKCNEQLKSPSKPHSDRRIFIENISKGSYQALQKTEIGRNIRRNKNRNCILIRCMRKVKRLLIK